jgi:hypothetical protein
MQADAVASHRSRQRSLPYLPFVPHSNPNLFIDTTPVRKLAAGFALSQITLCYILLQRD